jgi:hypothetical protein
VTQHNHGTNADFHARVEAGTHQRRSDAFSLMFR